jgi:SAM-dependent methyltransferase
MESLPSRRVADRDWESAGYGLAYRFRMRRAPAATRSSAGDDHAPIQPPPTLWFSPQSERFDATASLVREHLGRARIPNLRVHPHDDMYQWSLATCDTEAVGTMAYFRSGLVLADSVRQVCSQWFGVDGPKRLLDFACGYGRALRFIIDDLGADRVSGSEILPDAVEFVQTTLNATGLPSSSSPEALGIDDQYEIVVVSSLFTHLPEATFVRWLHRLDALVAPGGLLLVTVHDETHLPEGAVMPEGGLWFQPTTEVESLDPDEYGATVVSPQFMATAIEQACGRRPYRRFPRSWCFEQDLYVVPQADDADLSRLTLRRGAQGCVDSVVARSEDALSLSGWAATQDEGVRVADVEARLDGRLLGRTVSSTERPDIPAFLRTDKADCLLSGWHVAAPISGAEPDSVLTVVAHTTDGGHWAIWGMRLCDCLDQENSVSLWENTPSAAASDRSMTGAQSFRATVRNALVAVPRRISRVRSTAS